MYTLDVFTSRFPTFTVKLSYEDKISVIQSTDVNTYQINCDTCC